jgi:hypothetical protein
MKWLTVIQFLVITFVLLGNLNCKKETSCENCRDNNKPPTAQAGIDQIISLPVDSVLLDGSASKDPDGSIANWLWRNISGPASLSIIKPSESKTAIKNLVAGSYQFELKVTDNDGLSAMDTIKILVNDPGPSNRPPVSNAGADQTITLPTNTITLNGNGSTDPDNNITGFVWTKISGPSSFNIANANSTQTQVVNLTAGIYQFELKVTDAGGLNDKDTVQVTVNPEINNSSTNIYVAGMDNSLPVYWKNGRVTTLDNGAVGFTGTSIAVVGSDIYVAGTRNELAWSDYAAKYWKNGQAISLGDAAAATSIAVSGGDVYVGGWQWMPSGPGAVAVAKYWKNGQPVSLTDGTKAAYANCIVINGSDVYVAGQETANATAYDVAKYWKNGVAVSLTNASSDASANSITVVGNDVYVAGYENGTAAYWKNGQRVSLSAGTATSIAVVGNDVYVAGYDYQRQGNSIAKYWKNGQEVLLNSGLEVRASSIAVLGSDVYVAGFENNGNGYKPKYWKNGQPVSLPSNGGLAGSIVVTN